MTKEEIIEIYIEVSNKLCNGTEWCWAGVDEPLQLFAKLVAEKEREACAKICDSFQARDVGMQPAECAGAIRARGKND